MKTTALFKDEKAADGLLTVGEASVWASAFMRRNVTPSNISYLLNYGRIEKARGGGGGAKISVESLENYYRAWRDQREASYQKRLGGDLNWRLSFEEYKEAETTKHVHRLHPYKGKFIPQLAEYFLDGKTDDLKTESVFRPGDIVLDPFCGSGTTLVQANELGVHAVGVEVSCFNAVISNLKLSRIPAQKIRAATAAVELQIKNNPAGVAARRFERALRDDLKNINDQCFSSDWRRKIRAGDVDEQTFGEECARAFAKKHRELRAAFNLQKYEPAGGGFLDTWYMPSVKSEITAAVNCIDKISDDTLRDMLRLILSRTARTARATTHYDLATLITPVSEPYYCAKHGKICKPLFSMLGWWRRYAEDTVDRLSQFEKIRTDAAQLCLHGDARTTDIFAAINSGGDERLKELIKQKKIRGIFSSPPYVGLINYHEQHAYAYELFNYPRDEENEIGVLQKGQGRAAQENYARAVADVLINCRRFMTEAFDVFLVANDKFGLYAKIADDAGMRVVKEYKRPVLNRSEGNKGAYGESIFHLRKK